MFAVVRMAIPSKL